MRDKGVNRRELLKLLGIGSTAALAGCAGGPQSSNGTTTANGGGGTTSGGNGGGTTSGGNGGANEFLTEARKIDWGADWKKRRIDASGWSMSDRKDVPPRSADNWKGTKAIENGPWTPPANWKDSVAADVESISIINFGSANMKFDPATVATYDMLERETGIKMDPIGIQVDTAVTKEQAALSAGKDDPVMMNVDTPYIDTFITNGWVETMDPLFPDDAMWEPYQPFLKGLVHSTSGPYDGNHMYGCPNIVEGSLFHIRPDLMQEQGIDPSRFEGEWTWDLMKEVMDKFKGTDVWGFAYYAGSRLYVWFPFESLTWQQGGRFLQDGKLVLNSQECELALSMLADWRKNGLVPPDVTGYSEGDLIDLFLSGKLAMVSGFTDFVPQAEDKFDDSQYQPVLPPKATTGPDPQQASIIGPNLNMINKNASVEKKVAALLFADARYSYESQWYEFTYEGNQSYIKQVYTDAAENDIVKHADTLGAAMQHGVIETFPQMAAIRQNVGEQLQLGIAGDKSPKQALDDAQQFVDTVLGQ